jgi:hypothetical protein
MKREEAQKLRHGLYKIHWKSSGTSLAALATPTDGAAPPRRSGERDATGGRE